MALQLMRIISTQEVTQAYAQFVLNARNGAIIGTIPKTPQIGTH